MFPKTTNVEDNNFPPIAANWYDVSFEAFKEDVDKKGSEYTGIQLKIGDTNRIAFTNLSHKEDFLWKAKQFKAAIGMNDEETDLTPYLGTRLKAFLQNREYEGSNQIDVKKFKPFDSAQPSPAKKIEPESKPPVDDSDGLPF